MPIACVYCGGQHQRPSDVRECWQRAEGTGAEVSAVPAVPAALPLSVPSKAPSKAFVQWARSGPSQLGRGIVLCAGAEIPPEWSGASRIVIDQAVLGDAHATVLELAAHAAAGRRIVVELAQGVVHSFREPAHSATSLPPYQLGPRFTFALDLLHHLVWSNAIDATAEQPHWPLIDAAIALGATAVHDGPGDVELPDGSRVWLDGGPARCCEPIDGLAVLHAVAIEHGSLVVPVGADATIELAPDQRAAVLHSGGAARIIAPAGSGKTRVLTERARHLVNAWRLPPSAASLVAFNKRAQEEMQARTDDLRGLRVRTLNAIALAIVNGSAPFARQSRNYRTIDEIDVRRIIGRLVQFPRKRNTDPVATWIEALSMVRLGLRSPADVEAIYDGDVAGFAAFWPKYRAVLEAEGAIDFDDQIYRALELLLADAETRRVAQRACRLLLVDEFQDLTPAHVLLVRLLSAPNFSVFGVGDDDQTIYGYSGADPAWLIDFESLFPNAGMHPLEVNYRCPGDVVQAADRLVRHNRRRVAKVIRAARPDTQGLRVVAAADALGATVAAVRAALEAGTDTADIAVLTRVNALLAPVQLGLSAAGIAVSGGVGAEFCERTAIRAALAWVRLAVADPARLDPSDLAEALRRPSRSLHPNVATWAGEQSSVDGLRRLAGRANNERDAQRVNEFADDIERMQLVARHGDTARILRTLSDDVGLGASISTIDDSRRGMNRAAQNDDLVSLAQLATLQPDPRLLSGWLRQQLSQPRGAGGVALATVHRVKGQEWPVVVLHHVEADQYPHRLAEDLEEERRVFHVALTRGREQVTVIVGAKPSPFVDEMRNEPPPPTAPVLVTPVLRARDTSRSAAAASGSASPARDSPFIKGAVLAAPGLVIIDSGQEWIIESLDGGHAVARLGTLTRRFAAGAKVATAGRQSGPLRIAEPDGPSAASIRAHDLLRQTRDRLRNGKPAYVVFDDATLERIALALPTTLNALHGIAGIGPAKLEQYGDAVLLAIEDALIEPVLT